MTDKVLLARDEQIAFITLNRPEIGNAFDEEVIACLTDTLQQLQTDDQIRVLILKGQGKHFSAGADLNWMKSMAGFSEQENTEDALSLAKMLRLLNEFNKPTICQVQGAAYGGAVGIAACCDICIASEQAKFCLSEVKLGLIPAVISPYVFAAMGSRAMRRYMLTAEVMDARLAEQFNLVHEITPHEDLDDHCIEIAKQICSNGPTALKICKKLIRETNPFITPDEQDHNNAELIAKIRVSAEGQKGLQAFLAKNKPSSQ